MEDLTLRSQLSFLDLSDIVDNCGGSVLHGTPAKQALPPLSTDTRTLKPGEIFVALKGENFDGHQYIDKALEMGALAVVSEERPVKTPPQDRLWFHVPSSLGLLAALARRIREHFKGPVLAVTGSAGKSSTKTFLRHILGEGTAYSPASFNNLLGVSKTILGIPQGSERLILEIGMNALGEIQEICDTFTPDLGLITNIGTAHIGKLGSAENIRIAKKELFDALASRASTGTNVGVALNLDDPGIVRSFNEAFPRGIRKVTYSQKQPDADVFLSSRALDPETGALTVSVRYLGKTDNYRIPIFGLHQAENIAASIAGAILIGKGRASIHEGIGQVRSESHRGEVTLLRGNKVLLDEAYNSNPSALMASLQSCFQLNPSRRRVLVLGEMRELGEFSEALHSKVGTELAELHRTTQIPFTLFAVGNGALPLKQTVEQALPSMTCHWFVDASSTEKPLLNALRDGDVVLVKGSRGVQLDKLLPALKNS